VRALFFDELSVKIKNKGSGASPSNTQRTEDEYKERQRLAINKKDKKGSVPSFFFFCLCSFN